jgi:RNA polymerase sigma-70 factor (ECF subfamily)
LADIHLFLRSPAVERGCKLESVDRRISVLVAVAPRLLGDTLAAAIGTGAEFELVGPGTMVGSTRVDATVVSGHCPPSVHADVVLELPDRGWDGSGWLEVAGHRRQVAIPTVDAMRALLRAAPLEADAPVDADAPLDADSDAVADADAFASRLAAAKSGDPLAVTRLYRDHNPPLIRYLRSRAPMEAEDLASETWVGVSRTLANFDGNERAFRSWLFVIARNRLAGHYRSSGRHRTVTWPTHALEEHDAGLDVAEEAVRGAGADAAISALISGLSDEMAEVVRLRVIAGLSAAEAAALMGRSEGAVRVLQHRALRRLAERFSHREPADLL